MYPDPDCSYPSRSYDGGVLLGTGGPQHGALQLDRVKNYIRYPPWVKVLCTPRCLIYPPHTMSMKHYKYRNRDRSDQLLLLMITIHGAQVGGKIRPLVLKQLDTMVSIQLHKLLMKEH